MIDAFPPITREAVQRGGQDRNPAVQLFGRRFFVDQTVAELLVELLLVAFSPKRDGYRDIPSEQILPPLALLRDWPNEAPLE